MRNPVRATARSMLASMFVVGGIDQLNNPESKVDAADDVAPDVAAMIGLEGVPTRTLVRLNGAAQVAGGVALALGRAPRTASAVLAASLVPTTLAGHRYWEVEDPAQRKAQQFHFFKNVAMLGGLLLSLLDRGGRPGLVWRARHRTGHAVEHAREKVEQVRSSVADELGTEAA